MNSHVTIPKAEYDRLIAAAEDLADLQSVKQFLAEPDAGLPADFMARLIDGEAPLKVWRTHRGLTQTALAEASGVNRVQICDIETGRKSGSIETLRKLADVLDISLDDIT